MLSGWNGSIVCKFDRQMYPTTKLDNSITEIWVHGQKISSTKDSIKESNCKAMENQSIDIFEWEV